MGLFRKKKQMIDIRELQRRGMMRLPVSQGNSSKEIVTDKEGFVEIGSSKPRIGSLNSTSTTNTQGSTSGSSGGSFFGFMDNPASSSTNLGLSSSLPSTTTPSEDLRKISRQISDLDNKLYKMEQRIELLERKAGVGNF